MIRIMPRSTVRRLHGYLFRLPLMISCAEFEDFILAYLDDQLSPRQKWMFEAHLKICKECQAYLKAYRATLAVTQAQSGQDLPDVPEDLVKAVMSALEVDK